MKIIDKMILCAERVSASVGTHFKHNLTNYEIGAGAFLIFAGAVFSYRAGRRSKEEDYKGRLEAQKKEIDSAFTPKAVKDKAKFKATAKYCLYEARNVALPAGLTIAGVLTMKNAYDRVSLSKRVLEAALASSIAATQNAERVLSDAIGDADTNALISGGYFEQERENVLTEDGTCIHKLNDHVIFNVNDIFDIPGESFIYSKETTGGITFQSDENYFNSLVAEAKADADRKLHHTHGYYFDEDFVKIFGVEPKAIHKTNGTVNPDPKYPNPGDEKRGRFEILTQPVYIEYEDGSRTNGWLVTPMTDGSIIDIYHKYSLQRLLKRNRIMRKDVYEAGS